MQGIPSEWKCTQKENGPWRDYCIVSMEANDANFQTARAQLLTGIIVCVGADTETIFHYRSVLKRFQLHDGKKSIDVSLLGTSCVPSK